MFIGPRPTRVLRRSKERNESRLETRYLNSAPPNGAEVFGLGYYKHTARNGVIERTQVPGVYRNKRQNSITDNFWAH